MHALVKSVIEHLQLATIVVPTANAYQFLVTSGALLKENA